MSPPMLHTAYLVTMSRNGYMDLTASGETPFACHFRYITNIDTTPNNEQIQSDALLWCEPDIAIAKGSVVKFEGEHFMVERLTKARRLRNPQVLFIKCELLKYGVIS